MTLTHAWASARRAAHAHRRALAAVLTCVAVFATITALQPERTARVTVWAAARDVPGGTVLTAADLTSVALPADVVPDAAVTDRLDAEGATLNAPLTRLSVLTAASLASGQSLAGPGRVVVPLPVADRGLAGHLAIGARVDVLAPATGVVASDARVVALPPPAAPGLGGDLAGGALTVLVEVTPQEAGALAREASAGTLTVALR